MLISGDLSQQVPDAPRVPVSVADGGSGAAHLAYRPDAGEGLCVCLGLGEAHLAAVDAVAPTVEARDARREMRNMGRGARDAGSEA